MQPISKLATYVQPDSASDPRMRNVLESHIHYIRNHPSTTLVTVEEAKAIPFYYNLYAYLKDQEHDIKLHWPILIINDLHSPEDFNETTKHLYIPDLRIINEIIAVAEG